MEDWTLPAPSGTTQTRIAAVVLTGIAVCVVLRLCSRLFHACRARCCARRRRTYERASAKYDSEASSYDSIDDDDRYDEEIRMRSQCSRQHYAPKSYKPHQNAPVTAGSVVVLNANSDDDHVVSEEEERITF